MLDEYFADPAEETQEVSGDMSLSEETSQDTSASPLHLSPVLDRIRTSD